MTLSAAFASFAESNLCHIILRWPHSPSPLPAWSITRAPFLGQIGMHELKLAHSLVRHIRMTYFERTCDLHEWVPEEESAPLIALLASLAMLKLKLCPRLLFSGSESRTPLHSWPQMRICKISASTAAAAFSVPDRLVDIRLENS
jgi:hypothetical protein